MNDLFQPHNLSRRGRRRLRLEGRHPLLGREYDPYVVNDFMMARNRAGALTDRLWSPAIWSTCPWEELKSRGLTFWDDMGMVGNAVMSSAYTASIGQWSAYGYAGSTITDGQKEGGVMELQSDGDNEGVAIYSSTGSYRMVTTSTLALNKRMWYECRVSRSTITTAKHEFFAGLMKPTLASGLPAAAQPITTTDDTLMTAGDLFGFHGSGATGTRGGPTEVGAAFVLASGTVNYPTNTTTLLASTGNSVLTAGGFVKLGFVFDPNGPVRTVTVATARQTVGTKRRALIRFFVNNLELPTFLSSDDVANATATQAFPTAFMTPVFAVMNQTGSTPGSFGIDWVRVAQEANS